MTRYTHYWAGIFKNPVTRKEWRVIGIVAVICILLMATIVFAIDGRWQVAAITAVCAIPSGLFAGVFWVMCDRRPKPPKRPKASTKDRLKLIALNVVLGVFLYLVLSYAIPSESTRFIVLVSLVAVQKIARVAYRRHQVSRCQDGEDV